MSKICMSLVMSLALMLCASAHAQHSHGRRNTIELQFDTVPAHDEILAQAPEDLMLRFNEYVRLVKLTLKANDITPIDIGFHFSLDYSKVFIQNLPPLEKADYYTAEWAALNADNVIVYGYFCFSFGPDARRPTSIIDAREYAPNPFQTP